MERCQDTARQIACYRRGYQVLWSKSLRVRNRLVLLGLAIIVVMILGALLAPLLTPYDPNAQQLNEGLSRPSWSHPLGQDRLGRDILARTLYGARISLWVGISTALISLIIGMIIGATAGFLGGVVDEMLTRVIDVLLAFPGILLALVLMALLGPSLNNVILALCLVGWVGYARLARAQVLSIRERTYITAARSIGATQGRIICSHILPNILPPLLVEATFGIGGAIVGEAGLSFLGFGVQPPTPSWGAMLNEGRQFLLIAPHLTTFPGLAIMLVVLGFNFFGDGLRDMLDPRL
ncbi:MAG: ABC transporter permease [Thermodesulfobacteriota bacterium]|nr:ABC transporter permease [Thermodesulfobacteriota bacterium]